MIKQFVYWPRLQPFRKTIGSLFLFIFRLFAIILHLIRTCGRGFEIRIDFVGSTASAYLSTSSKESSCFVNGIFWVAIWNFLFRCTFQIVLFCIIWVIDDFFFSEKRQGAKSWIVMYRTVCLILSLHFYLTYTKVFCFFSKILSLFFNWLVCVTCSRLLSRDDRVWFNSKS